METRWSFETFILYIVIALIISILFRQSIIAKKKKNKFPTYMCYYIAIYIILILFSCFRTIDVENRIGGADAPTYIKMFQEAKMPKFSILNSINFKNDEFIFFFLLYIARLVTTDYHILFFIIYSIIICSYIFFVHQDMNDEDEWTVLMLLFIPFVMSFNIIRNCLAVAITIFAFYFLKRKKDILFIIMVICAFFTHYTTVFIFLFYFYHKLCFKRLWKNKKIYAILLICAFVIAAMLKTVFSTILLKTGYSGYAYSEVSLLGYIPNLILLVLVYIFNKEIYKELEENNQLVYLSAYSFWNLILAVLIFVGGASRVKLVFDFTIILVWSKILKITKNKLVYKGNKIGKYMNIIFLIVIIMWIIFKLYRIGYSYGIVPYHTDLF